MNQLFFPREPVLWKKMRFNSKAETDLITNWRALQGGLKTVGIDKEIPIGRLIAKKPGDNVEFAQWFHKFYMANISKGRPHPHPDFDPVEERRKRGIELQLSESAAVKPKVSSSRITKPKSSVQAKRPQSKTPATLNVPESENVQPETGTTDADHQVKNLKETITFLEKERDFYFGKLRDIEILCQDQPFGNALPITEVINILYSTEEGFASPDTESECSSPSGASVSISN